MSFIYREITISGASVETEGTSKLIQEIKDILLNEIGWTLTDDQTNRAGTSHQLTLQSNGELGNFNTFYLILTSGNGISATVGQDVINFRAATAWDSGTHRIPASGVGNPTTSGNSTLGTDSNAQYTAWISGDKDAVTFITKVGTAYDGAHFGAITQFTSTVFDQFPFYLVGGSSPSVDFLSNNTSDVYTFISSTVIPSANSADWEALFNTPLGADESPNNIFGSTEAYVALPIVAGISQSSNPVRKSVRGFSKNIWATVASGGAGSVVTIDPEDELLSSDGRVYKVFFDGIGSTRAVVIRRS